ncbi:MAG: transcriptional regulator [Candidatus Hodarchaeota archaeon]
MSSRRERILELLKAGDQSLETLVELLELNIAPKRLEEDIWSIHKTVKHKGYRLVVQPAECLNCSFRFKPSSLLPSRCPQCKAERINASRIRAVPVIKKQKRRKDN